MSKMRNDAARDVMGVLGHVVLDRPAKLKPLILGKAREVAAYRVDLSQIYLGAKT